MLHPAVRLAGLRCRGRRASRPRVRRKPPGRQGPPRPQVRRDRPGPTAKSDDRWISRSSNGRPPSAADEAEPPAPRSTERLQLQGGFENGTQRERRRRNRSCCWRRPDCRRRFARTSAGQGIENRASAQNSARSAESERSSRRRCSSSSGPVTDQSSTQRLSSVAMASIIRPASGRIWKGPGGLDGPRGLRTDRLQLATGGRGPKTGRVTRSSSAPRAGPGAARRSTAARRTRSGRRSPRSPRSATGRSPRGPCPR